MVLGSPVSQHNKDSLSLASSTEQVSQDIPKSLSCFSAPMRVLYGSYHLQHLVFVSEACEWEYSARRGRVDLCRDARVTRRDLKSSDDVLDE